MPRIFACLALSEFIVLLLTGTVGVWRLDPHADRHVLLAVLAILLSCMIQVAAFTYLTVVEKATAQAVHLGRLALDPILSLKRLKKRFTRYLGLVLAAMLLATATGASAWRGSPPDGWHFVAAMAVIALHVCAYLRQYGILRDAGRIAAGVLVRYSAARACGTRWSTPP